MTDDEFESRLRGYRDVTARLDAPAALTRHILATTPRRARARRDAFGACLLAASLSMGSGLWAMLETFALERQLFLQVSAWTDAP
jgi:hypothetical protein